MPRVGTKQRKLTQNEYGRLFAWLQTKRKDFEGLDAAKIRQLLEAELGDSVSDSTVRGLCEGVGISTVRKTSPDMAARVKILERQVELLIDEIANGWVTLGFDPGSATRVRAFRHSPHAVKTSAEAQADA